MLEYYRTEWSCVDCRTSRVTLWSSFVKLREEEQEMRGPLLATADRMD